MSDASNVRPESVVDVVDDGMTDEEIAAHTDRWRAELAAEPTGSSSVSAAELLEAVRADEAL